ncbi:uncharacterized protein [Drosophila takahashii]|uniref:uncharacterized protein n=1 Tax=Drosophila takahashii TaxID=29030 RepID=UPI0007E5C42A|nr:uncharacterized protein LOC108069071 [Drosophila takahashii]
MLTSVFCMRLNTYGVVIGWLGVIFSFLATILLSVALGFVDKIAQQIVDTEKNDMTVSDVRNVLIILFSIYLALKVINLLASAMLVVGTVKERHLLLLPWLINNGVILALSIVTHIGLWAQVIGSAMPFMSALPILLISVSVLLLSWYLYYGIYSLFKQIQASSDLQRPLIPPVSQQTNSYPSYTKI